MHNNYSQSSIDQKCIAIFLWIYHGDVSDHNEIYIMYLISIRNDSIIYQNQYFHIFQGCQERKENFKPEKPYYSAFRENDYGYTRLKAHNKTHIEFSQVSDDKVHWKLITVRWYLLL